MPRSTTLIRPSWKGYDICAKQERGERRQSAEDRKALFPVSYKLSFISCFSIIHTFPLTVVVFLCYFYPMKKLSEKARLEQKVKRLSTFIEVNALISSSLNLDQILENVMLISKKVMNAKVEESQFRQIMKERVYNYVEYRKKQDEKKAEAQEEKPEEKIMLKKSAEGRDEIKEKMINNLKEVYK